MADLVDRARAQADAERAAVDMPRAAYMQRTSDAYRH